MHGAPAPRDVPRRLAVAARSPGPGRQTFSGPTASVPTAGLRHPAERGIRRAPRNPRGSRPRPRRPRGLDGCRAPTKLFGPHLPHRRLGKLPATLQALSPLRKVAGNFCRRHVGSKELPATLAAEVEAAKRHGRPVFGTGSALRSSQQHDSPRSPRKSGVRRPILARCAPHRVAGNIFERRVRVKMLAAAFAVGIGARKSSQQLLRPGSSVTRVATNSAKRTLCSRSCSQLCLANRLSGKLPATSSDELFAREVAGNFFDQSFVKKASQSVSLAKGGVDARLTRRVTGPRGREAAFAGGGWA